MFVARPIPTCVHDSRCVVSLELWERTLSVGDVVTDVRLDQWVMIVDDYVMRVSGTIID